jgi:chromosomal replication initiation ATPase DnaA
MPAHAQIEIDPYPRMRSVVADACKRHGIHQRDLFSGSRAREIRACRFDIWWVLHRQMGFSLNRIGDRLGGYHHATVLNGVRRHDQAIAQGTTT